MMKTRLYFFASMLLTLPFSAMSALDEDFKQDVMGKWQSSCFPVYNHSSNNITNFNTTTITISPTLSVLSEVKLYAADDKECQSNFQLITLTSNLEVVGMQYTQNSFEAYAVNAHTQTIDGGRARWEASPTIYTTLFVDSETLYFAKSTDSHSGANENSRHNSLDMETPFITAFK